MSAVVHIPLYSAAGTRNADVRYMVAQLLACLGSYFAHGNSYDVLVTTNDWRILEVLIDYQAKTRYHFDLKLVSRDELRRAFHTDDTRLNDWTCTRTIFSKFYPIMSRQRDAILHVDCDTIFLKEVDLSPLFVSAIGVIDSSQFQSSPLWRPTDSQADFLRLKKPVKPVARWVNSGVFAVQGSGFEICQREVRHYLENLERARADQLIHGNSDELIMNALVLKERKAVAVVSDYNYNFIAYYLKYDPAWRRRAKIVHFHSLKPDAYRYVDGVVRHECDEMQAERLSDDFYLAALIWFRYLHIACNGLRFEFPTRTLMPQEVVEKELAKRDCSKVAFR
ncbi:MAG TPA: hypothetical protein VFS90_21180 [Pyrinomonadaceae bacterium]|nr:hypothetical protein [Pyrinomonadaceae bacterium]